MDTQPSKLSTETTEKAVNALIKWNKSKSKTQKPQLLESDDFFYLILTLKKIPPTARTNPYKIPLPHPFHPFDSSEEYCLIIDDRSKSSLTSASAKKKIQSENIPISKVLKLSKLKSDYRPFEAKRKLCNSYDMFFADKRVIPLLPRLLGKEFFKKKKIPVPVDLTRKSWKEQIQIGCESALLYLRTGTCSVLKVGRVSQGRDEIVANVAAAVNGVVEVVPKKWANVRSFHLKLTESLALPVYQAVPQVGLKIEGIKKAVEVVEDGKAGSREEDKEKKVGKKKAKKGRIHEVRYMDDDLLGGNVSSDDEDVGGASKESTGVKRKKPSKKGKKRTLEELSGEKELKKSAKVKKGDSAKKKEDGLSSEEKENDSDVVDNVAVSPINKKKKKGGEKENDSEVIDNVAVSSSIKKTKKKGEEKEIDSEVVDNVAGSSSSKKKKKGGEKEIDSEVIDNGAVSSSIKKKKKGGEKETDGVLLSSEVKEKSKKGKTATAETRLKTKKSKRSD